MVISCNQKGAFIIAAVFIIVILGFMGAMFVTLIGTGSLTAVNDLQSAQALSVAEGGLEYALANGTFCTYSYTDVLLGNGRFSIAAQQNAALMSGGIDNVTDPVAVPLTAPSVGFLIPGLIRIDSEYLLCSGTAGSSFTGCKRRFAGSAIAAHTNAPVTQCGLTSTGTVGSAVRTVRRAVDEASLTRFTESFPPASVPVDTNPGNTCSSNPALAWCYQYTNNQGTSRYHADNAPPSTGGSLEAESSAVANAHLAGYREHFLPATIGPGRQIRARLWYKKTRGHAQTQLMDMFVELIATDGTVPVQWPVDAQQIRTVNWTSMVTPTYTVLPGITIDRIRLSFDIQNRASGGGAASPSYVWFDDVQLEEPAGILALSWQELIN